MARAAPTFGTAARFWLLLGWINFGGPAGQIALMHRELVERRRWLDEERFAHALNFCMLLPGPEAMQLAIYSGWLLHGTRGAVVAGLGFVLPAAMLLLALTSVYVTFGEVPAVSAVLSGFKPVVVAIVFLALITIGRRSLKGPMLLALAAAAFVAVHFLRVPFPWIVLGALVAGILASTIDTGARRSTDERPRISGRIPFPVRYLVTWLLLTLMPFIALALTGGHGLLTSVYAFFTRAAYVTFGGAYAVLSYVNQAAVERFGWLSASQSIDGFALAETTPGPLIIVLQFVGFLAGWNHPGDWPPLAAAIGAALLASYATFLPSFFFILIAAPYVERLRALPWLTGGLATVTAAVVGVILNLGVTFAAAVLWSPTGLDLFAAVLATAAAIALVRGIAVPWVVLGGGVVGLATHLASSI